MTVIGLCSMTSRPSLRLPVGCFLSGLKSRRQWICVRAGLKCFELHVNFVNYLFIILYPSKKAHFIILNTNLGLFKHVISSPYSYPPPNNKN